MANPKDTHPLPPHGEPRKPDRAQRATTPPAPRPAPATGRIVHDERGTAVWDWLRDAGRAAIESTSRLLRKLELPELKVQDEKSDGLSLESEKDAGGGYDPYNQGKRGGKRR
jgi:hypothetical protein